MRKAGKIWAAGLLLLLLINGCGKAQTMGSGEEIYREDTFSFVDDLGREVTVGNPERVAALIGSFTDIWLLAGGTVTAAANDSWESLNLPLGEDVVNLGSIQEPDIEKLIASQPELVLASANTDADLEMEEILKQAGIPTAYFAVSSFEEQIEKTRERIDGSAPKVLFLRASSSSVKAKGSEGNVCGEMLSDLGCINIADSDQTLLEDLSMEAIIAADPDYIFVTFQGNNQEAAMQNVEEMLLSNPAWTSLSAVT